MQLSELKLKHVSELVETANQLELEGANRLRKQELIFALLKHQAKKGEAIFGDGTLEFELVGGLDEFGDVFEFEFR